MIKKITNLQPKVAVKKLDTSYGANLTQPTVSVLQPKITPSASVTNGIDMSYAANLKSQISPIKTRTDGVDMSYKANLGQLVTPITPDTTRVENKMITPTRITSRVTQPDGLQLQDTGVVAPTEQPATPTEPSTPLTYKEYIEKQNQTAQDNLDSQKALIEQQRQDAVEQADNERAKATIDARSSYAQNLATYGANAETLGGMGLSGSGYSDYINAQAYAQQRADTQQAKAQAAAAKQQAESVANQQNLEAQMKYQDYVAQNDDKLFAYQEEQRKEEEQKALAKNDTYANLLNGINTGAYTAEQAGTLADTYGLDAAQKQSLIDAATKYETDRYNAGNATVANGVANGEADKNTLDAALSSDIISQEQYNTHLNAYQTQNFDEFMLDVKSGNADISYIDIAAKNGEISQEQYKALKAEWNNQINTKSTAFDGYGSYQEAKSDYEEIMENDWLSPEKKAALEKCFLDYETKYYTSNVSSGYNAHSSTVTLNTPFGKHTVTYKIAKYSISVDDERVTNAGSGQVFLKDGKVYVKLDDGKLGEIQDYWGQGAFEALKNMYSGTVYDLDK